MLRKKNVLLFQSAANTRHITRPPRSPPQVVFSALLCAVAAEPQLLYSAGRFSHPAAAALPHALGYGRLAAAHLPYAGAPLAAHAAIAPAAYAAPAAAPVAVAAAPAPVAPAVESTQYHKQDELGNYEYGYNNINSAKRERGNAYAGVEGSYSYLDSYGQQQSVSYVADALGFRAVGTNVPVNGAHLGAIGAGTPYLAHPVAAPLLARRFKRSAGIYAGAPYLGYANYGHALGYANYGHALGYASPYVTGYASDGTPSAPAVAPAAPAVAHPAAAVAPAAAVVPGAALPAAAYSAPAVAAPAAREAILTRVQLNPGHAVAYRVD